MATLTPEDAFEAEVQAGRMISSKNQAKQDDDSDDDVDDEAKLQKARAWDNFKDDNPRGWGNSKK